MALPKLRGLASREDPQLKSAVETAILQIEPVPAAENAPDPEAWSPKANSGVPTGVPVFGFDEPISACHNRNLVMP